MSDRGVYAILTDGFNKVGDCLIIGRSIPRVHHADGLPVYLVVEHPDGILVATATGTKLDKVLSLLAYPSHWPAPGGKGKNWVYAYREPMPFNALLPVFDDE